jgi:predicted dienelactone hydrolase
VTVSYGTAPSNYVRTIPVLVRYPQGATGKLPVVVWSHGGVKKDEGKYQNDQWGDALVRAGYIVVHMSHPPRTSNEVTLLGVEFGIAINTTIEANIDRPRDAIAVLNALPAIEAAFAPLQGRIDYARIGLGGHSRGAYTVRTVACARTNLAPEYPDYSFLAVSPLNIPLAIQPKAFLANSPQGPDRFGFFDNGGGNHSWRECTRPDLTQTGAGDNTEELAVDRIKPYELMPAGDKYKMYIDDQNSTHETFNLQNTTHPQFNDYVRSTGVAFFDAYLKQLPDAKAYLTSKGLASVSNNVATIMAR